MSVLTAKVILGGIAGFLIGCGYLGMAHCLRHFDGGYFAAGISAFGMAGYLIHTIIRK